MKSNITHFVLAVVLAVVFINLPMFARTKVVSSDCACEAIPLRPLKPATVVGIASDFNKLSAMYPGDELVLVPKVRMSRGPLTRDLTVANSNPDVVKAEYDPGTGQLVISALKPGTASVAISPAKDDSKTLVLPVTVKDKPVREVIVNRAGSCGFPWGWLIFAVLLALLAGALPAWLFARRRNRQELDDATNKGRNQAEQNYRQQIAEANRNAELDRQALNQAEIELRRLRAQQNAMIEEAVAEQRARAERLEVQLNVLRPVVAQWRQIAGEQARLAEIQRRLADQVDGILNPPAPAV